MKKITVIILIIVGFVMGGLVRSAIANYDFVEHLAWQQIISSDNKGTVTRVEWFDDVCYLLSEDRYVKSTAISCVKNN